jgi:hypothetical protein
VIPISSRINCNQKEKRAQRREAAKATPVEITKKNLQKVKLIIAWSLEDFASLRLCVNFFVFLQGFHFQCINKSGVAASLNSTV